MDQWSLYVSGYDVNYLANSSANTCISIFNISVTSAMKNNSNKKKMLKQHYICHRLN